MDPPWQTMWAELSVAGAEKAQACNARDAVANHYNWAADCDRMAHWGRGTRCPSGWGRGKGTLVAAVGDLDVALEEKSEHPNSSSVVPCVVHQVRSVLSDASAGLVADKVPAVRIHGLVAWGSVSAAACTVGDAVVHGMEYAVAVAAYILVGVLATASRVSARHLELQVKTDRLQH